jgi:hypothetical protein
MRTATRTGLPSGYIRHAGRGCCDGGGEPDACCGATRRIPRATGLVLAGLGDDDPFSSLGAAVKYCGKYSGDDNTKCFTFYTTSSNKGQTFSPSGGGGSWLDSLLSAAGGVAAGAIKGSQQAGVMQTQAALMQAQAAQRARTMQYAVIGGIALVGIVLLTRRGD